MQLLKNYKSNLAKIYISSDPRLYSSMIEISTNLDQ
jgi:hypothetical protein